MADVHHHSRRVGQLRQLTPARAAADWPLSSASQIFLQFTVAFLAYFIAGKLGQATSNIRSSNLGPVWPAYGIALSAFLAFGYRIWPAIAASAFIVAASSVPSAAAAGQVLGVVLSVGTSTFLLHQIEDFDPTLSRLKDALGLIIVGAFGGAIISASVGILSLYLGGIQPYSGIRSAWLIYWLGDSTGALLITPLVFTTPQLLNMRSRAQLAELAALVTLLTAACLVIFGDFSIFSIRLHVLAFAVLPFVMWGAINFGTAGAALSVFLIATLATLLTALGSGPFSVNTPFINAALLDVLFAVLAVSGLTLAAVIAERKRAESEREQLIREQVAMEGRLRLAAIVESSDDAILTADVDGIVVNWNHTAARMFGFTEAEAIGQPLAKLLPAELRQAYDNALDQAADRPRVTRFETVRVVDAGPPLYLSVTVSPSGDAGASAGVTWIARDITDQKRAEEVFAGVNRRLIDAQEQERARIARELHDDIGQRLALINWKLTGQSEELQKDFSDITSDLQELSRELHPSRLEMLGIVTGIKLFCQEFSQQKQVTVNFEATEVPNQVPSNLAVNLFRVVQEALHNSAKHSGVREFEVRLWAADNRIHAVVSDHGAGFGPEQYRMNPGIGLITMQERMKLIGGDLSIKSRPGHGTTVHARVPVVD